MERSGGGRSDGRDLWALGRLASPRGVAGWNPVLRALGGGTRVMPPNRGRKTARAARNPDASCGLARPRGSLSLGRYAPRLLGALSSLDLRHVTRYIVE